MPQRAHPNHLKQHHLGNLSLEFFLTAAPSAKTVRAKSKAPRARPVIFVFMLFSAPSTRHSTLDTRPSSLDHLVRSIEHRLRNREADLLGSF
jgi:hypothetical protein